jgi:uncharacterized protein YbaP (TraB family)
MPELTRRRWSWVAVLVLTAGLLLGPARPASARPSIWVVHGEHCTVTLFGSIHVLPKGLDWEPPALVQALSQADELWFEIPVGPQSQAQASAEALARGFLPAGQDLSSLLSPEYAGRLAAFANRHHLSLDRLNRMRPWFADLLVSSFSYMQDGAGQQDGVEAQLTAAAPQAARRAFETAAQQVAMVSGAPPDAQIASLDSSLREADSDPGEYQRMVDAWMKGDGQEIYRHDVLTLRHDAPDLFRILITDRNAAWTRVLADRLKGSGQVVVVVGAAHLLGPEGVAARLRALGYRVDGPAD